MNSTYHLENQGQVVVPAISGLLALTSLFVGMRLYTRALLSHSLSWDDLVLLFGYMITLSEGILMMVHTKYGQGYHWDTLSPSTQTTYLKIFYATLVLYYLALGVIKTAILLQYMRIFTGQFRKITVICMIVIGMWSTSIWLVTINTCTPVRAYWDKSIEGRCIPNLPQWYINAAGNILTDLVIVVLPIKALWNLHLPKSQRLSLIGVFALGFFTCAISLIRVFALSLDSDLSYKNIDAAIWSFAELACALITASLPTLRPIMYRILPRIFHPSIRSSGRKTTRGSEYARYGLKSNSTTPEDESSLTKPHTSTEKLASDTSDVELQVRVGHLSDKKATGRTITGGRKMKIPLKIQSGDRRACLTTICAGQDSNSAHSVPLGGINVRTETYIEDGRL